MGAGNDIGVRQLAQALTVEGLTQLGDDGRATPRLARSWTWVQPWTKLRIALEPGVVAHDGLALTTGRVAEALRAALAKASTRAMYPALSDVTAVEVDGADVLVTLSKDSVFLPEDLEIPLELTTSGIGTGPYKITRSSGDEIDLERFDRYRGGVPAIASITLRPLPSLRPAWAGLLRDEVDLVTDVPPGAVEFVANADIRVLRFERRYQYLIAFNSTREHLKVPGVRRALNLAIDRDALIRSVLQGHGVASSGPLWHRFWARDTQVGEFGHDPAAAMALLERAGLRMPSGPPDDQVPPARFHFTCLVPEGFAIWERLALEVQRSLFNIGVDMQLQRVPFAEFNARIGRGDFDATFLDMVSGPTPSRSYIFWRSPSVPTGLNVFGYDNPKAESLFDTLRRSGDEGSIRAATRGLQREFLNDPPALFLAWNERARAVRAAYQVPDDHARDPIASIWRWTLSGQADRMAAR